MIVQKDASTKLKRKDYKLSLVRGRVFDHRRG